MQAMPVPTAVPIEGTAYCGPPVATKPGGDLFSLLLASLLGRPSAEQVSAEVPPEIVEKSPERKPGAGSLLADALPLLPPEVLAALPQVARQVTEAAAPDATEGDPASMLTALQQVARQVTEMAAPEAAEGDPASMLTALQQAARRAATTAAPSDGSGEIRPVPVTRSPDRPTPPAAILARVADGKPMPRGFLAPALATPVAATTLADPESDAGQPWTNAAPTAAIGSIGAMPDGPSLDLQPTAPEGARFNAALAQAVVRQSATGEPTPPEEPPASAAAGTILSAGARAGLAVVAGGQETIETAAVPTEREKPKVSGGALIENYEAVASRAGRNGAVEVAAETVVEAPSKEWISGPEFREQLVGHVRMLAKGAGGEAQLQLKPENLGRLHISLQVHNGQINLHMSAESPLAREAIVNRLADLATSFATAGLTLGQVNVTVGDQPQGGQTWSNEGGSSPKDDGGEEATAALSTPWLLPLSMLDVSA